jgi:hypothetical protein
VSEDTARGVDYSVRVHGAGYVLDDREPHKMACYATLSTRQDQEGAFCVAGEVAEGY